MVRSYTLWNDVRPNVDDLASGGGSMAGTVSTPGERTLQLASPAGDLSIDGAFFLPF